LVSEGAPALSSPLMLFSISYWHRNSNINIKSLKVQTEYGNKMSMGKEKKKTIIYCGRNMTHK